MVVAKKTALGIADVLIERSRSSDDARAILEALSLIPGSKSYRDTVALVKSIVMEKTVPSSGGSMRR
jgi:hypothetical protein